MEINRQVCALRTSLAHVEKTLGCPFTTINSRTREVENYVQKIIEDLRIRSFFVDHDDEQLRKLHLLILINTDLSISAELECDGNVGHAVGAIPRMSPYLYFHLTYHYKLMQYLVELVEHGPVMLALELVNLVNSELKSVPRVSHSQTVFPVLMALISRIRRTNCDYTSKKLFEQFQMLMLFFKESNDGEDAKKSDDKIKYEGYKFLSLISLLRMMTNICFDAIPDVKPMPLYDIKIPVDPMQWYQKSELKEKSAIISECYEMVFFKCRDMMRDLDLAMYLSWHEIQFSSGKTLQKMIGEGVYYLCQSLEQKKQTCPLPASTKELISMLQSVAVKPEIILLNIDKSNIDQLEWMVLEKKTFDMSFLQSIECFLQKNRFRFDIVTAFVHKLCDKNTRPGIDEAFVKRIISLLLKGLNFIEATSFLIAFIAKYGTNHFLVDPEVDFTPLIKRLNDLYLIGGELDEDYRKLKNSEVARNATLLAFHASRATFETLLKEGSQEKNNLIAVLKMFDALRPLCLHRPPPGSGPTNCLLTDVLREFLSSNYTKLSPAERNKFSCLVVGLNSYRLFFDDNFLVTCVLPLLYLEEDTDQQSLADLLKLFEKFYRVSGDRMIPSLPIILIQLAQLLEESRWHVTTFTVERVKLCEGTICLIESLLKAVSWKSISAESKKWFEEQCPRFSHLTKSYFMSLLPSILPDTIETRLISLIHRPITNQAEFINDFTKDENAFVFHMAKIIITCTYKELYQIVQNFGREDYVYVCFILDLLSDAIIFISNAAAQLPDKSESVFMCLGHSLNNFLQALGKVNVTRRMIGDDSSSIRYINRIATIMKIFPKNLATTYQFNVIKCIMEFLPRLKETTNDFDGDARQLLLGLCLL